MSGPRAGSGRPVPAGRTATPTAPERAVAARLRRLDAAAGSEFAADLWAARGYETRHPEAGGSGTDTPGGGGGASGGVLEATRGSETVTVAVVSPSRLGSPPLPDPVPDVVAVLGDAGSVADRLDGEARVLDAGDLAAMLLYAVDRPVADGLCESHFGVPPEQLRSSGSVAVRRRLGSLGSSGPTLATGLRVAGLGLAAVLVAVGIATLGGPGVSNPTTPEAELDAASSGTGEPTEAAAVGPAEEADDFPQTYPEGTADLLPPGVTQDGIDDAALLGRAHSERLAERSYALTLTRHQPAANGSTDQAPAPSLDRYLFSSPPQPGVTHTTAFAVAGDAYRSRATLQTDDGARVRASVYFTDGKWHIAAPLYGNTSFRSAPVSGSVGPLPETFRDEVVDRYLSTPETELTGVVERDERRLYRVVATGTPRPFPELFTQNYTAVALVDNRGIVHNLSATYDIVGDDGTATIETSVSYGSFGEVGVRPPPWYINRFDGE